MSKKSSVEKNNHRKSLVEKFFAQRLKLKTIIMDRATSPEERFLATLKLAEKPRNSAKNRIRNRCSVTGRSRGYYRKFKISRIELRSLASEGKIPGMVKASW